MAKKRPSNKTCPPWSSKALRTTAAFPKNKQHVWPDWINSLNTYPMLASVMSITFFIVTISWIFFRSQNIGESFSYLSKMLSEFSLHITYKGGLATVIIFTSLEFIFRKNERKIINFKNLYLRWFFYFALSFLCFSHFRFFDEINFLYFQF